MDGFPRHAFPMTPATQPITSTAHHDSMRLASDDATTLLYHHHGFPLPPAMGCPDASPASLPVPGHPSVSNPGAGISDCPWGQRFVGGSFPPQLPFGDGHAGTELLLQHKNQAVGDRNNIFAGSLSSQQSQKKGGAMLGSSQPQSTGTAARPRVRARRGQATDPHSIAERLRRERIAVRMKSLQELVPNSNKADRASMLDEIIEFVKFLQLQVKVLSMSRLGNSVISPLLADLTVEGPLSPGIVLGPGATGPQDGLAVIEHQVARLMEENMGSAMQFLQGKGLCLMPLSLAAAISCTNSMSQQRVHHLENKDSASGEFRHMDIAGVHPPTSKTANVEFGSISSSQNGCDRIGIN